MNQDAFLRIVKGETRGVGAGLLRLGLRGAALGYGLGVDVRNRAFDRGRRPIFKAQIPVVSVGNLTLGGTGKTPMVEWICRWYRERELRVAILSRGYGAAEGLNDEGRVLDQNLPDVPHLQDRDRSALARIAFEELESQLVVLDDGFQHRGLARDLDVVLLDALDPFGQGRLFPSGLLREPIASLKRAHVVVLSRADLVEPERRGEIRGRVEAAVGSKPWVEASHAPTDLVDADGESFALSDLDGRRVLAFCGIGNPEGFRRTLAGLGVVPAEFRIFPDHHPYTADDVRALERSVDSLGADLVLTTQKDLAKLRASLLGRAPVRAVRIGLEILSGREALEAELARLLPA